MNFIDLAKARYSVRSFSDKPVEPEKLAQVLEAGRLAPTARNIQPQYIYVLQGESLAKAIKASLCTYNAPVVLVVCYDKNQVTAIDSNQVQFGFVDTAAVITHMLLAATDIGLGTCWVGLFDENIIKEELGIADNLLVTAFVPLGYEAKDAEPSPRHTERKAITETVKFV